MTLVVYGAGSVGLLMSARLARSGADVLLATRREDVAREIGSRGVQVEDAASGERWTARVPAVSDIALAAERAGPDAVLFCMRGGDLPEAARALRSAAPGALVVSWQNDVDPETRLARHFPRVIGGVVRQTSTRTSPITVTTLGDGRLVVGDHPGGVSPDTRRLARALRGAGYDVGLSRRIAEDKWLKLCVNLMSAPNALIRREDHATAAFVELKAGLLEEARDALAAAGIAALSCDGRDRSLEQEIAHQRGSLARGTSARPLPLYNQVWTALRHGGPLEADGYHRRVIALALENGLAAPRNERVLALLERAARESLGPESLPASAF